MITKDNFLLHIKKIEEELNFIKNDLGHKQSNIFRTIINLSPNAIMVVNKGVYVYANPTALLFFGAKKKEDLLNKPILETVQPEFHKYFVQRNNTENQEEKNKPIILKLKRFDNEEIYTETIAIPIKYNDGNADLIIGRDVTNEIILKKQLEENEELLEETERLSKIGRYKINLTTGKASWSRGLYDIFNFSYDAELPDVDSYYRYVHPEDNDKVKAMLADSVLNNSPFDLKYRILLKKNTVKYVHSKGKVKVLADGDKYLIGFYRDITQDVRKEKEIKEKEYNLHLLIDTIQEGIALNEAIYDKDGNVEDYKILFANKAFDRNSEYRANDVIGKKASDAYQMDKKYIKQWWQANKNADFPVYTEMHRPEAEKWAYISTSKIIDDKFVTAFFDITDKKKKDLLLEETKNKYKSLVENSPTGVIQITKTKFLFANKKFINLLGYDSFKNLENKSFFEFLEKNDKIKLNAILDRTYSHYSKKNQFIRITISNRFNEKKEIEMLISLIKSEPEETWQCIISDISEKTNIKNKAKKISTDAIYMSHKLHQFSDIESQLDSIIKKNSYEKDEFNSIYEKLRQERNLEQLWSVFQDNFEHIYDDFFKRLLEIAPSLTQQELKHCAFIKMNFETKEIALMFHVKPSSIQTSRVRLKKKLGLSADQDLVSFIITL